MPPGLKLKGLSTVLNNLNREVGEIEKNAKRGMFNAARLVRQSTETKEPKVPVDTSNLRNSWTQAIVPQPDPTKIRLRFGYTAAYAFFVHEKVDGIGGDGGGDAGALAATGSGAFGGGFVNPNWKRPGSGPKWFQVAINREKDAMVKELAAAAGEGL